MRHALSVLAFGSTWAHADSNLALDTVVWPVWQWERAGRGRHREGRDGLFGRQGSHLISKSFGNKDTGRAMESIGSAHPSPHLT